jgi:hypothetical protein
MLPRRFEHALQPTAVEGTLMTDNTDSTAERICALAQARGLERAYALYPEAVTAAVARGTTSLGPLPADFSSETEPAIMFDAEKLGGGA